MRRSLSVHWKFMACSKWVFDKVSSLNQILQYYCHAVKTKATMPPLISAGIKCSWKEGLTTDCTLYTVWLWHWNSRWAQSDRIYSSTTLSQGDWTGMLLRKHIARSKLQWDISTLRIFVSHQTKAIEVEMSLAAISLMLHDCSTTSPFSLMM